MEGRSVQTEPAWEKFAGSDSRYGSIQTSGLNPSKPTGSGVVVAKGSTLYPPPGGAYIGVIWLEGDTLAPLLFFVINRGLKNGGEKYKIYDFLKRGIP